MYYRYLASIDWRCSCSGKNGSPIMRNAFEVLLADVVYYASKTRTMGQWLAHKNVLSLHPTNVMPTMRYFHVSKCYPLCICISIIARFQHIINTILTSTVHVTFST